MRAGWSGPDISTQKKNGPQLLTFLERKKAPGTTAVDVDDRDLTMNKQDLWISRLAENLLRQISAQI